MRPTRPLMVVVFSVDVTSLSAGPFQKWEYVHEGTPGACGEAFCSASRRLTCFPIDA